MPKAKEPHLPTRRWFWRSAHKFGPATKYKLGPFKYKSSTQKFSPQALRGVLAAYMISIQAISTVMTTQPTMSLRSATAWH